MVMKQTEAMKTVGAYSSVDPPCITASGDWRLESELAVENGCWRMCNELEHTAGRIFVPRISGGPHVDDDSCYHGGCPFTL